MNWYDKLEQYTQQSNPRVVASTSTGNLMRCTIMRKEDPGLEAASHLVSNIVLSKADFERNIFSLQDMKRNHKDKICLPKKFILSL